MMPRMQLWRSARPVFSGVGSGEWPFPSDPYTVHLTADHIARGRRHDPASCPIAIALTEALGVPCRVSVGGVQIGDTLCQITTSKIEHLVRGYDSGRGALIPGTIVFER